MKTITRNSPVVVQAVLLALFISSLNPQLSTFAQGSLTPPGAPAPTMKTLAQIEPRTPISSVPFNITIPGSYYLTTNLSVSSGNVVAISIAAPGVTLDLNGFAISSTDASATSYGILLNSGLKNITIVNGFVQGSVVNDGNGVYSGSGFGYGIYYSGIPPVNVLVSRVSVAGCLHHGIFLNSGDSTVVESCTVRTIGGVGILASTIKSCSAIDCGSDAITGDQASDCRGQSSGSGYGVYASSTAQNCYGTSSSGTGLSGGNAQNCYGTGSNGIGLSARTAQNCCGFSSGGIGLYAYDTAQNCCGESTSGTGLYAANANFCTASRPGGTAIQASIGIGCYAMAGTNSIASSGIPSNNVPTAAQCDARTPISSAPFTITNSGSYYLTTNLAVNIGNAIIIATNGVTLDLNGFTIRSTASSPSGTGIFLNGGKNITIANGFIQGGVTNNGSGVYSGSGFVNGISYFSALPANVLISKVSVSGCLNFGISLNYGDSTVVESCTVRTVGGRGIVASTIKTCSALDCGETAIFGDQVSDCRGQCFVHGMGIFASTFAQNCYGYSNGDTAAGSSGYGLLTYGSALNCYGSGTYFGLVAVSAKNCYGYSSSRPGLFANSAENCYGQSFSHNGLEADTAQNCYGYSDTVNGAVIEFAAQNCYGYSGSGGVGLYVKKLAIGCYGYSYSGLGLVSDIANSCRGETAIGTAQAITFKYNMP